MQMNTLSRVSQFSNSTNKFLTEALVVKSCLTDHLIHLIGCLWRKNVVRKLQSNTSRVPLSNLSSREIKKLNMNNRAWIRIYHKSLKRRESLILPLERREACHNNQIQSNQSTRICTRRASKCLSLHIQFQIHLCLQLKTSQQNSYHHSVHIYSTYRSSRPRLLVINQSIMDSKTLQQS